MRVALTSYPMLWQRTGGLQVQIRQTLSSLSDVGIDVKLMNTVEDRLSEFDVLHVFGAINGNHRIVEAAREVSVPVVISPVLHPPFSRWDRVSALVATKITAKITGWKVTTSYEQVRQALHKAQIIIALGAEERSLITDVYHVADEKVHVVPNGVAEHFFESDPALFYTKTGIRGEFILQVSSVTPYKNPLASARVARQCGVPFVLIGPVPASSSHYLEKCRDVLGSSFYYLGCLDADDPLLSSAYAAASVFLLPSLSEVMPLTVLEALAAGTPVVVTENSSLNFGSKYEGIVYTADPLSQKELTLSATSLLKNKPCEQSCKALVIDMKWNNVASKLADLYSRLMRKSAVCKED